jgi:ribosomal protein S8
LKIYINQDEIDFTLEKENALGEVFDSIEKWLSEQSFSITELFLDDNELLLTEREKWESLPVQDKESFRFIALTLKELKEQNLNTVLNYCRMLQLSLKEGNLELLNELLGEYNYIEGSYSILLEDLSNSIKDHMANLLKDNGFIPEAERSEENVKTILEAFMMLEAVIHGRLAEVKEPQRSGKECYEAIVTLMPQMENVSLMLQTGKDKDAMNVIIRFTELFQKLLRVFTYLPEKTQEDHHEDLKAYIKDMSGVLKELTEAFASEDSVLMGDLMEYEILPRMKSFPRYFESISGRGD